MASNFTTKIQNGIEKIKAIIRSIIKDEHDDVLSAHQNGFDHNISIRTPSDPTLYLKQTTSVLGAEDVTMGQIIFADKNAREMVIIDVESHINNTSLEFHINNPNVSDRPTFCRMKAETSGRMVLDMADSEIHNASVVKCGAIEVSSTGEANITVKSLSNANGTVANNYGTYFVKDKNGVVLSAIDTDTVGATSTVSSHNAVLIHVAGVYSTSTSSNIPSVCKFVNADTTTTTKRYLDMFGNEIKNATVTTPTGQWDITNKKYVDEKLAGKAANNHTHSNFCTLTSGSSNNTQGRVSYMLINSSIIMMMYHNTTSSNTENIILLKPDNFYIDTVLNVSFSGSASYNRKGRAQANISNGACTLTMHGEISEFATNESVLVIATGHIS